MNYADYISGLTTPAAAAPDAPTPTTGFQRKDLEGLPIAFQRQLMEQGLIAPAIPKQKGQPPEWIEQGFQPAFSAVTKSSLGAGQLALQGYGAIFRARAGSLAAGLGEAENSIGGQAGTQGLTPDVGAGMLLEKRMKAYSDLGTAQGETAGQSALTQSELVKGTGTEIAGMYRDMLEQQVNYLTAGKAASAAKSAGKTSAFGSIIGAGIGLLA